VRACMRMRVRVRAFVCQAFSLMIEEEYRANLLLDNLPVRGKWRER
jgi:hypothetical protein